jgi:uncharacterized membrane protein YbhN (UPF0104 family)
MMRALKAARMAFGLCLLGLLVWVVDFDQLALALHTARLGWIGVALALIVGATLLGALAMHMLISTDGEIRFTEFLPVYWTAWAVGLVFPGQVGDMASMAALLKRHRMPMSTTVGRSMADKLVSLALMICLAAWAVHGQRGFGLLLGGAAALAVFALLLYRQRARLARFGTGRVVNFVRAALAQTRALALRRPGLIAMNTLLTGVKIGLTGLGYWAMFRAFGFDQPQPFDVIPLVAISSLVAYIPISLNGLGTAEAAGIALFGTLGVSAPGVLASYLVLRALGLAVAWVPAALWLLLARPGRQAAP